MAWWLVIVFCQVPMALYPNEDSLLVHGIYVDGAYHHKLPGEPVPFKRCL